MGSYQLPECHKADNEVECLVVSSPYLLRIGSGSHLVFHQSAILHGYHRSRPIIAILESLADEAERRNHSSILAGGTLESNSTLEDRLRSRWRPVCLNTHFAFECSFQDVFEIYFI
jgi:hypothetical protein